MNCKREGGGGGGGADSRNATPTKKKRGRPRKNSPRFIKRSNRGNDDREAAKALFPEQNATPTRANSSSGRPPPKNSPQSAKYLTEAGGGASKELFAESSGVCDDQGLAKSLSLLIFCLFYRAGRPVIR